MPPGRAQRAAAAAVRRPAVWRGDAPPARCSYAACDVAIVSGAAPLLACRQRGALSGVPSVRAAASMPRAASRSPLESQL
eukprot:4128155-Prymnesium_polylepis.2